MPGAIAQIMATFTVPESIGVDAQSMLWLVPLTAAIAVVYKATKVSTIKAGRFAKECLVLFGSIMIFMIATAVVLYIVALLINH